MTKEAAIKLFEPKKIRPKPFDENKTVATKGGSMAGNARKDLENKLGESVIGPLNAKGLGDKDNNDHGIIE